MILRGLIDRSLGGFLCIRGYAPLGELARASHADMDYQRDLINTQKATIVRFLEDQTNLFFPEVILSCLLAHDPKKPRAIGDLSPLATIAEGKGFRSNVDGVSIALRTLSYKGRLDVRARESVRIATLDVPESLFEGGKGPLFRIDGNHRLSAAQELPQFKDIMTPYCVLLFESGDEDNRKSKTIFHNINSKSIPLTLEESYRIILKTPELFADELLKSSNSFGWKYWFARHAKEVLTGGTPIAVEHVQKKPHEVLVGLFGLLLEKGAITEQEDQLPGVIDCLRTTLAMYTADPHLRANQCLGLFIAFVYFALTDGKEKRLAPFRRWVAGNHLATLTSVDANALIEIFEKVHLARKRTIFVSMQFDATTDPIYETITKTVTQINKACKPEIKIEPLRIDKMTTGHSYTIPDEILAGIENSGLLIADLTHGNKNVYHEVGFLMGLNQGKGVEQDNFLLIVRNVSKEQIEKDVGFNLRAISHVRFKETIDLEKELDKAIRAYYELGDA